MPGSQTTSMRMLLLAAPVILVIGMIAGCGGGDGTVIITPTPTSSFQEAVATGDFNGDGRLDLAVATSVSAGTVSLPGQVEVFFQDPLNPGFFFLQAVYEVGNDPFRLAAGDLNGDGRPDLAVANSSSDSVSVLINNPLSPGNFRPAVDFATGPAPLSVAIGDLDGDGLPDITVAVADGVDILFQNLNGTFSLSAPPELALTDGAFSVAVGDLDGDGFPDIAAAGADAVFVFFQDPLFPGEFFLPEGFVAGVLPNAVAVADIDLDGLDDIAVANNGALVTGSGASVTVLIQDPLVAGNFLTAGNFTTPNGAQDLAVGDLDGDGFPDIAVASVVFQSNDAGVVSVLLQDPFAPGIFFAPDIYLDGFTPQSVAIGDLDGDARPDIAVQDGPEILFQDPLFPGIFFDGVLAAP